ncbi:PDCD5-related protein [Blastocladiella britannica]|nr:PDCD5-related protein [Blastocladiella britannica]
MDDSELAAIRARRMAELQARRGGPSGSSSVSGLPAGLTATGGSGGGGNGEDAAKQQAADEMRKTLLMSVLDNEARERLARIAIVKPQHARSVEDAVLRMAQSGQLQGKITEQRLIELLGNMTEARQETKVVFNRRKAAVDSDDDDW